MFVCLFVFVVVVVFFLSRPAPLSFVKQIKWRKLDERTSKQDSNESLKIFIVCLFVLVFLEY